MNERSSRNKSPKTALESAFPFPGGPNRMLSDLIYPAGFLPWLVFYTIYTFKQGSVQDWYDIIQQRMGRYPEAERTDHSVAWIHGVSVGEVMCIPPLIEELNQITPEQVPRITTSTLTGHRIAQDRLPDRERFFFPIDLPGPVRNAFRAIQPDSILLVEQELWPLFLQQARRDQVPVAVVNARMTARSHDRFRSFPRRIRRQMFGSLDRVLTQNDIYAERYHDLGVPETRLHTTGNVKYDAMLTNAPSPGEIKSLADRYDIKDHEKVLVGGSIHPPEEERLLDAFDAIRQDHENETFRLILVPRHLKNSVPLRRAAEKRGYTATTDQELTGGGGASSADVVVVNTMGLLTTIYGLADLVFVGGSLIEHGGQNMLEPAVQGCPVIVGPNTGNFEDEVAFLKNEQGLVEVRNGREFVESVREGFQSPDRYRQIGDNAKRAVQKHQGAAQKTIEILERTNFFQDLQ